MGNSSPRVSALVAHVAHAAVEGTAFVWTKDGFRALLLLHSAALMYALGPRRALSLGVQCGFACSAARFGVVLFSSSKGGSGKKLESIWDFEPPGDLGSSGAWKVLKELAMTMTVGMDSHEELKDLEPLPLHELIIRLTLLYKHIKAHPYKDSIGRSDLLGEITTRQVDELCKYLYFADQSYDCGTEANLRDALGELGYDLNFAKLEATWADHCPAYFMATNTEEKELVVTIRGTAQIEDVVTDLTALPTEFEDSGHLVHGGMHASALWLYGRLLSLIQGMQEAGYSVTLVGHSLGAGAAALLSMMLKARGVENLRCFAFATPNCADVSLAENCAEYVTSVVFRDDIVARFSPEALASLHHQLRDLDLEEALADAKQGDEVLLRFLSFLGSNILGADKEAADEGAASSAKGKADSYRPHIPGRVVYIYRKEQQATQAESESDGKTPTQHELALVKNTCKALRCIRLSDKVVADHLIDSYFEGFGRKNPSKERLKRLAAEKAEAEAQESSEGASAEEDGEGEQRKQKSAEDRDKEEKDRWRSWKAKLGLVG